MAAKKRSPANTPPTLGKLIAERIKAGVPVGHITARWTRYGRWNTAGTEVIGQSGRVIYKADDVQ